MFRVLLGQSAGGGGGGSDGYYQSLTVDHTKLGSSDLTNYPVLVSVTDAKLKSVANGGHVDSTAGVNNIWFASTSSGTSADKIPFEIRKWDATTGQLIAWVLASSVSHTSDTLFGYLRYGDSAQTSDLSNHGGVWDSSFYRVNHGGKAGAIDGADSTSNGRDNNLHTPATAATGKIDTAGVVSATGPQQYTADNLNAPPTTAFSMSCWWKAVSNPSGSVNRVIATSNDNPGFTWSHSAGSFQQSPYIQTSGNGYFPVKYTTTLVGGTWYLLAWEWDGSNMRAYLNGALDTGPLATSGTMGSWLTGSGFYTFTWGGGEPGSIEEMRITKNTTRSASWNLADYNNQNSPSTFVTFGTETAI
jgi:hypothetical protein